MIIFRCDRRQQIRLFTSILFATLLTPVPASSQSQSWSFGTQADASKAYRAAFGRQNETTIGSYIYLASSSKLIWMGQGKAVLVLAAANTNESHASSGTLAVVNLKLVDEQLIVVKRSLVAGGGSTWGGAPEFTISSKIGQQPVVYTEGGGTWQGCTSGVADLIELSSSGPHLLASFPAFYEPPEGRGTKGKITNVRFGASFDVVYTGAKRFVDRYVRRGNKYVLVSGPSKAETC
jgi:hypothetical protein